MKEKTSVISNGLIWFGAAVSIAEILTGTYLASLGMAKGMGAILLGHLIGGVLMYLAGLIGGKTGKSSMETVKMSYGEKGALFFSGLNVLQLVGWTAIMIISGARATAVIAGQLWGIGQLWIWCLAIGLLIILWIAVGIKNIHVLNYIAMGALLLLTIALSFIIFKGSPVGAASDQISFGAAVELSVAMPLSWLPLISDYTREAKKPVLATGVSTAVYFITSCWMYAIGMGAAIFTGESDISRILLQAGLGIAGVVILIISTVTTTFLDAHSAGVSTKSISKKIGEKPAAVIVCIIGIALAIFTPIENFESFLYLIGSVFAPMIAVQITDFYVLKREPVKSSIDWISLIIWVAGFVIYRGFMYLDTPIGNTLPVMILTSLICIVVRKIAAASKRS